MKHDRAIHALDKSMDLISIHRKTTVGYKALHSKEHQHSHGSDEAAVTLTSYRQLTRAYGTFFFANAGSITLWLACFVSLINRNPSTSGRMV